MTRLGLTHVGGVASPSRGALVLALTRVRLRVLPPSAFLPVASRRYPYTQGAPLRTLFKKKKRENTAQHEHNGRKREVCRGGSLDQVGGRYYEAL